MSNTTEQRKSNKVAADSSGLAPRDETPFIEAAWLYYHNGMNQSDIAERMQISRASVVNYLSEARKRGWVRVYLDNEVFLGQQLSEQLCTNFGLKDALVVPDDPVQVTSDVARVTRAAADWLPRLLKPGDMLGVSWGETIYRLAQQMTRNPVDQLTVVQLLGSRPAAPGFAAEACTTLLAQKLDGHCINLHVPLLLSSKSIRDTMCREPVIADQLTALASCNKTLFACGTCAVNAHVVQTGLVDKKSIKRYTNNGAVGVICGRLIDANGKPVVTDAEERMIGVTLEQMRNKETALLLAAGPGRAVSARAAINGGYVTHLATSSSIARELLAGL